MNDLRSIGTGNVVYRKGQAGAIESIVNALTTKRIVFLDAPTGSGKSLINLSVAHDIGTGYITTPQTLLVNQYDRDIKPGGVFEELGSAVMGRQNYPCPYLLRIRELDDLKFPLNPRMVRNFNSRSPNIRKLSLTSAMAPCTAEDPSFIGNVEEVLDAVKGGKVFPDPETSRDCPFWNKERKECPYYSARDKAMDDRVAVTTFHYFKYGIVNGIKRSEHPGEDVESLEWDPSSDGNSKPSWRRRDVLIIDEAHNLPDFLVNFYTVQASSRWPRFDFDAFIAEVEQAVKDNPDNVSSSTFSVFKHWFKGYYEQEEKRLGSLMKTQKSIEEQAKRDVMIVTAGSTDSAATEPFIDHVYGPDGSVEIGSAVELTREEVQEEIEGQKDLMYRLGFRKHALESGVEWIYVPPPKDNSTQMGSASGNGGDGERTVSWKPYEASPLLAELWSLFPRIVFSSATFLDIPTFLERLGLGKEDYDVVRLPSTFNGKRSPIIFPMSRKINKSYVEKGGEEDLATVVREIERIASLLEYRNEKGVVHFPSYEWFRAVYRKISPELKERVITHTSVTRNDSLDEFRNSTEPKVLFAIKMEEGTDFRDEQARWQILVKVPYQDLGDEWVRLHKDRLGQRWYEMSALQQVIQASGRIMRSETDWGDTYILDRNAQKLIQKYKNKFQQ
jgi:Rad3-related DNA helicase